MCKRVFVLNKGKSVYEGDFRDLVRNINPKRKLVFEFDNVPDSESLISLKNKYSFDINDRILTAILSEIELQDLLKNLLQSFKADNITFEDIPVDDAMKSFFENPQKYIK